MRADVGFESCRICGRRAAAVSKVGRIGVEADERDMSQRVVTPESADVAPMARRWRWALSLVIGFHVLAVFLAPFTFASTPAPGMSDPSPAALSLMRWMHPYIEALYLQHGYAFFAPDPGPSHLFKVKLEYADGRPTEELTFPDLKRHRPRLMYHRHFMLSERLVVGHVPGVAPPGVAGDMSELMRWRRGRETYETYFHTLRNSYVHHLQTRYGADKVSLVRVEHRMAGVDEVIERHQRIDARDTYEDHPEDVATEVLPSQPVRTEESP